MAVTRVSVRELVEFCERGGDINFRFTARSTAMAGIRGHQRLQKRRGETSVDQYVAEKSVADCVTVGDVELQISGRVDGYFPGTAPLVVDEIKTVRTDAGQIPDNMRHLHLAQARVYALLLAREEDAAAANVRVCYLQLDDDSEVRFEETIGIDELERFYQDMVSRYAVWDQQKRHWLERRDATINALPVPFGGFRAGQREMAVSTWRALRDRSQAIIQAPTGIGKTLATLYPAVRALAAADYERVFFLTAKGSGQQSARDAMSAMREGGLELIDVTLTAKEKACFNPGVPCHPEHCAYAAGYYDRLPAVLSKAVLEGGSYTAERTAALAEEKGMCPFELGLDLATVADVVVCDYNYVFDPWVYLRRFFDERGRPYAFLVDEAHNLVDRGRDMFSARLEKENLMRVRRALRDQSRSVWRALDAINREILSLRRAHLDALEASGAAVVDEFPLSLLRSIRRFCEVAEEFLVEQSNDELLQCYFDASRFLKTADLVDGNYRCLLEMEGKALSLRIIAVNPAPGLRAGFERAAASVAFSATLAPQPYFRELIGANEGAPWFRLPSPFPSDHMAVITVTHIGTTLREREGSLDALVECIASVVSAKSGNYLVFFPSHRYLADALVHFRQRYPDIRTVAQTSTMSASERAELLASYDEPHCDTLVGFAVTGGIFGEGVDLKGDRLIGVLIVGVGLPAPGADRTLIGEHFADRIDRDRAFRFAFQYPGVNRVLQAAGRVIRSPTDRGIVCLIDPRFAEPRYSHLLPSEWRVTRTSSREDVATAISTFWRDGAACAGHPGSLSDSPCHSPGHSPRDNPFDRSVDWRRSASVNGDDPASS